MTDTPTPIDVLRENAEQLLSAVPWAKELGFEMIKIEKARAFARMGWQEQLVSAPETGVIAGGVITSLLDNICGVAVGAALTEVKSMATLDLRIDYMRPATKGEDIIGEAECYHITQSVAFCRAWAYHEDRSKVVATASAAFALNDPKRWAGGALNRAMELSKEKR